MVAETVTAPTTTTPDNVDLARTTVILSLRMTRAGNRRRVSSNQVEVDADKDAISVNKELLESDEFKEIVSFDGYVRRWLYTRSLPAYGTLKSGIYRIPTGLVSQIDAQLQMCRAERDALVDAFIEAYPARVQAAKTRLRSLFNPTDYPPAVLLPELFTFEFRYMAVSVPTALSSISQELLQREIAKAEVAVKSEADEIKLALRQSFAELIDHAASRLAVKDGKKLIFRDTLVSNITEFLEFFNARNVVGDDDLSGLVDRARDVMSGIENPDKLREDGALRGRVRTSLQSIKKEMDENLMLRPARKISFDDEA